MCRMRRDGGRWGVVLRIYSGVRFKGKERKWGSWEGELMRKNEKMILD